MAVAGAVVAFAQLFHVKHPGRCLRSLTSGQKGPVVGSRGIVPHRSVRLVACVGGPGGFDARSERRWWGGDRPVVEVTLTGQSTVDGRQRGVPVGRWAGTRHGVESRGSAVGPADPQVATRVECFPTGSLCPTPGPDGGRPIRRRDQWNPSSDICPAAIRWRSEGGRPSTVGCGRGCRKTGALPTGAKTDTARGGRFPVFRWGGDPGWS